MTRKGNLGVRGEGVVVALSEPHAQCAAHVVARIRGPELGERGHEVAVVLAREVGEVEERRHAPAVRLGREDPGARVGGTTHGRGGRPT